jgi:outer membrane immunogenic protein
MKKLLLSTVSGAACGLALTSAALAADVAIRPSYQPAPAPLSLPAPPPFTWTACYVGGHVGAGWGTKTWNDLAGDDFSDNASYTVNGFVGGVQGGCDWQFAGPWVLGFEGKWSWTDLKGSGALPFEVEQSIFQSKVDWISTATARLGVTAFDPHTLLYVKGGGAWARETHTLVEIPVTDVIGTASTSVTQTRQGWTVGMGVEWAFAQNWSAKLEYNYMDFGSKTVLFAPLADDPSSVDQKIHTFTVGLNYRFNWH